MTRRYRAAVAGYYGFGNLGDELLLQASIETLSRCGVERDAIVVLSNTPDATSSTYGVPSVYRWSFGAVRRALSDSDTLMLGGGGIFQDSTSVKSCLWYYWLIRLARLCGAKPWALGQSIGPLRSAAGRALTRWALGGCAVLQLRDAPSMDLAVSLGLNNAVPGDDLALTLTFPPARDGGRKDTLLLNLRHDREAERYASVIAPYVNAFDGRVTGVALSHEDESLLKRLGETTLNLSRVTLLKGIEDAAELWSDARAAIGMRLHFAVISALYGTPLAVLPYDPKTRAFAERVGAACMDIQSGWEEPRVPVLPVPHEAVREEADRLCRMCVSTDSFSAGTSRPY